MTTTIDREILTWERALEIIQEELNYSEEEAEHYLRNQTGWPIFWDISDSGGTAEECLRAQIQLWQAGYHTNCDTSNQIIFAYLARHQHQSTCGKKQVIAGTFVNGSFWTAVNQCRYEGDVCPRLNLPGGTNYELCHSNHAEARLAKILTEQGEQSDGIAYVLGQYYACRDCALALKDVGVKEIRVRESLEEGE